MSEYAKYFEIIDKLTDNILEAEQYIWKNPETGYREWKTHKYLAEKYRDLGYKLKEAGNIPGFTADIDTGRLGPRILIFGEMDSLICNDHPDCDPETGAVHACGHNAQSAALLGIAEALVQPGIMDNLCGSIRLCAVPAEELIEIGYREGLRKAGTISYLGGKVEFLHRGYLDGCDISFMIHSGGAANHFSANKGNNGCVLKNIEYKGKAAHAGGSPHDGINALYAANLGLNAINALRETFKDGDHIRVHPIITYGGAAVNAIPSNVKIENYVRGATFECIEQVNKRVNRALAASAAAMGANVEISDRPGYAPLINDVELNKLAVRAMKAVVPEENVSYNPDGWGTGCTDMGDMSAVIPSIHPHCGGTSGTGHGNDYRIADPISACVNSAKMQLALVDILLRDNAAEAKRVIDSADLRYKSVDEYFKAINAFVRDGDAVNYRTDGVIELTMA